jgi:hypothetical protein
MSMFTLLKDAIAKVESEMDQAVGKKHANAPVPVCLSRFVAEQCCEQGPRSSRSRSRSSRSRRRSPSLLPLHHL